VPRETNANSNCGLFYSFSLASGCMSDGLQDLASSIAEGLRDRTLTSCSRWASARRIMGAPFPGPYSWKRHPWVKELHDSWAPFNYAMKGAQLGVTEVAINRAFYTLDRLKRDVLYVLPTSLNARDFSKSRFGPALSNSPYIKGMFTDTNTVELKQAGANTLYIRGSRTNSNLKSIPASELLLDEIDEMEQKQIWLALERLSGQIHKHVWGISTPTIPNYGIHKLYLGSTQEHFVFKCPCCSRQTELIWPECVEICGEHETDIRCKESFLKCKECKGRLDHALKSEWLADAFWQSFAPNANPEVRGFYINQLYSFTVSPGELVVAYFRGFGDELAAKEFKNSKLGLPHIGDGAKVDDGMLDKAVELGSHTKNDERPRDYRQHLITMGVDQGKWGYIEICDWSVQPFAQDVNVAATCKVLWEGKFFENDWGRLDELMREWQVQGCVIDADPEINEARRFAKRFPGFVWLCRYRRGVSARQIQITDDEDGAPLATVDRSNWLSASLGRFKCTPPRIVLPRDVSHEYREHMKALVQTYVRDSQYGNPVCTYVETGPDHFAHARTYNEIALPLVVARSTNQDIRGI
jgi:hypothetical protein